MIISHKLKIIFIHVHRTGGTTLSNILKQELVDNFIVLDQHENAKSLGNSFLEKHRDYKYFGFTRNPWARILSWYSLIHLSKPVGLEEDRKRLEESIENDAVSDFTSPFFHYNTLDYFSDKEGELIVDQIFHYEDLINEISKLFNQLNLPLPEIPILNKTTEKNYSDYYTDKSRSLIAEKCKKDIGFFNYKF